MRTPRHGPAITTRNRLSQRNCKIGGFPVEIIEFHGRRFFHASEVGHGACSAPSAQYGL
jgi:hypothetical protein